MVASPARMNLPPPTIINGLADLARVPADHRSSFATGIELAMREAWELGKDWSQKRFDPSPVLAELERTLNLAKKLRATIAAVDVRTAEFFSIFDVRLPSFGPGTGFPFYQEVIDQLLKNGTAAHAALLVMRDRPHHRPPISPWDTAPERFVAMAYGTARVTGGRLSVITSGTGHNLPGGTLPEFLGRLKPYLPPGLVPPTSLRSLARIKKEIDRKLTELR
jgi:hypothetical protein